MALYFRAKKEGVDEINFKSIEFLQQCNNDFEKASEMLKNWYSLLDKNHSSWAHRHYSKIDVKGVYFPGDISAESGRGRDPYDVLHPISKKPCKVPTRGWPTKQTMQEWIDQELVDFGYDETTVPKRKRYLSETDSYVYPSVIYKDSRSAYKNLYEMFAEKIFDNPKDLKTIQSFIDLCMKNEDIVLDFFSGSATTAHAVMQLNAEDEGNRKFILVQLPEITANEEYPTICEIGKERIRRAGEKIIAENSDKDLSNLDVGFKVLKLGSSNIKAWDSNFDNVEANLLDAVENIKSDRTSEDLLFEILLKYGLDLTLPIEEKVVDGKKVFVIGYGALVACLDDDITIPTVEAIAKLKEHYQSEIMRVVFKDASFKDAVVKTNAYQILKQFGIDEVVSV